VEGQFGHGLGGTQVPQADGGVMRACDYLQVRNDDTRGLVRQRWGDIARMKGSCSADILLPGNSCSSSANMMHKVQSFGKNLSVKNKSKNKAVGYFGTELVMTMSLTSILPLFLDNLIRSKKEYNFCNS
jgi:hypothetical protein